MHLRTWILAWAVVAGGAVVGQTPSYRVFAGREGLPQSQVQVLAEDRHGFMWVGTHGGVARLGSHGFQTFEGISGLKGNRVSCLLEAPDGAMWVGYEDGGLVRVRGNQAEVFGPAQGLDTPDTFALALGPGGTLYAATRGGLFRGDGRRFARVPLPSGWGDRALLALGAGPDGALWIGSHLGRVGRWDGHGLQEESLPSGAAAGDVQALQWDPLGRLWALGTQGLARRSPTGAWEALPLPGRRGTTRLTGLSIGPGGEVLVAMGTDGLLTLPPEGRARTLGAAEGVPPEGIYAALRDRAGHLWLGTNGGGLRVQAVPGLVHLGGPQGRDLGGVLAFLELGPSHFLIGSTRGLFRFREGQGLVGQWDVGAGLPSPVVRALEPDGRGGVWVATTKGLARWQEGRIQPAPPPLNNLAITHFQKSGEVLWAGTDRGLACLRGGRLMSLGALPPEVGQRHVYSLRHTRQGLLVGTMHGVYAFQDGPFLRRWGDAPFATQPITDMREGADGRLWVATTKGLYAQEGAGWRRYGVAEGLPDELIWVLGDGGRGRLAVGHGKGITLLQGEDMIHLNQEMGLLSDETNQGGILLDSRQRLWVGMIGGLSRLEPALLPAAQAPPPPLVEEVRWPKGFQVLPREATLPPHAGGLDFHWDVGFPLAGRKPRYQVRMQGLEAAWRSVEGTHLPYGRLPPGSYRFQIRASLDGLRWVEGAPVDLRVQAAWHESPWVRTVLAAGLLALGAAGVTARIRRLKRAKQDLERKVQERTAALAASEQKAREASQAKSLFLANMSHELRTPLNAVLGFAQLMDRDPDQKAATRENLGRILRAGEHLLSLINDVLSISKIEAGKITLNVRAFDTTQLLQGLSDMAQVRAQAKGIDFRLELSPEFPSWLEGDDGKLRQVLLNLLGNAIKFTDTGGVLLRAAYRQGRAHFEVTDTGPGISPEEAVHLFAAFHQTDVGRKQQEGTGLGLHIGQAMVRLMGGEIRLRSQVGQGSTFSFDIPLFLAQATAQPGVAGRVLGLAPDQVPPKVLVVDDVAQNRDLVAQLLGSLGIPTREAGDGLEALEAWEAWGPDIVLMDIRMPRMNGFEALGRIRALESARGLPRTTLIALTASAFDHDTAAMLQAGFDDHIGKPFKEGDLFAAMARLRGIRFTYDLPPAPAPGDSPRPPALTPAILGSLPEAWKAAFREALHRGDPEEATTLLEGLENRDLAAELQGWVNRYRFDELSRLFGG